MDIASQAMPWREASGARHLEQCPCSEPSKKFLALLGSLAYSPRCAMQQI